MRRENGQGEGSKRLTNKNINEIPNANPLSRGAQYDTLGNDVHPNQKNPTANMTPPMTPIGSRDSGGG